ncbi:glycosyltransferase [Paludisphaera rhizosphaerae]|uniref:glycosyltransferase n=1 Tax=Paludisphaera rhizosphaerae TaxID=2711216 RepID=UPI0013EC165D|nr:glycosyltransferase [Paludisphaera rhizosphaerae]
MRRNARRLVFDFDDAVMLRDSFDRRGPHSARRRARFARIVRAADVVIAGNDYLADQALRAGASAETVCTIPTCIDLSRYAVKSANQRDGPPELVWIGSSSTLKGLEERRDLWERLGAEIPGLRLRVVCDRFPRFQNVEVVEVRWSDVDEARDLAMGDIGVGLIPDDDWSRGKCGLKILQYQAAGLPVIANRVGSHLEMIEPGETGFLADDVGEWAAAITAAADRSSRARMGEAARRQVEEQYSTAVWGPAFAAAVTGVDLRKSGAEARSHSYNPCFNREKPWAVGGSRATPAAPSSGRRVRRGSE